MSQRSILIISKPDDSHAISVVNHLKEHGVSRIEFLDLTDIGKNVKLSVTITLDQVVAETADGRKLLFSDFDKIWWRRIFRSAPPTKNIDLARYRDAEFRSFIEQIQFAIPGKKLFPKCTSDLRKRSKIQQLIMARAVGLDIPVTVIGNSGNAITEVLTDDIAVKPLNTPTFRIEHPTGSKSIDIPTRKSNILQVVQNNVSITSTPIIVQDYLEKKCELRITIVGEQVFACAIDTQAHIEGKVDGRFAHDVAKHWVQKLPINIEKKLLRFMNSMNLDFACVDMIITPDDRYIFLEANLNGQWLWIEEKTGMKISKAIADQLMYG